VVSEAAYRQLVLEEPDAHWELDCGRLRQKPGMTAAHNQTISRLLRQLYGQLDERAFDVRSNDGRVRLSPQHYYIPDVCVVPIEMVLPQLPARDLEAYGLPLPLIVEVWSPSTGKYDVGSKLVEYQRWGDLEIWLIHPYDRTLIAWVRQPDGSYVDTLHTEGIVRPEALAGVAIDLSALFA